MSNKPKTQQKNTASVQLPERLEKFTNILKFWRSVEYFTPQKLPKFDPQNTENPVFEINATDKHKALPWEVSHPLQQREHTKNKSLQYLVYCAVYPYSMIVDRLQAKFGRDSETFDERTDGDDCVFAFTVSFDGKPLFNTFILSTCAWALTKVLDNMPDDPEWVDKFDIVQQSLLQKFQTYCEMRVKQNITASSKKAESEQWFLREDDLFNVVSLVLSELGFKLDHDIKIRIKCTKYNINSEDNDFLNSFYVEDLQKVSKAIARDNVGTALESYLSSDDVSTTSKIDVRKDLATVFNTLSPRLFPRGRWASKGHYPLVYSQQFAINSIFKELSNGGLFAINGPPGTGKTTLLNDLIANIVVERAICLSGYRDPESFFPQEKIRWKSKDHTRVISTWPKEFDHFSIVVASSNNGAVENVTLEIPSSNAIDASWMREIDYFKELSDFVLKKPTWALLAARLGNQKNRNEFLNDFWYGSNNAEKENFDDTIKNPLPFLKILSNDTSHYGIADWKKSLKSFENARDAENKARQEAIQRFDLLESIIESRKKIEDNIIKQKECVINNTQQEKDYVVANEDCLKLTSDLTDIQTRRTDHRQFRPRLIDIILTFGKAYSIWWQEDQEINNQAKAIRKKVKSAQDIKGTLQSTLTKNKQHLTELQEQENTLQLHIEKAKNEIQLLSGADAAIPAIEDWEKGDAIRECSSPWANAAWNRARTVLFLEALKLHKTFILVNADIFRKNLHALADILGNKAPKEASPEGAKAAWLTLFFVIPVVSTTFASFDRIFKHLGKEDIGWLFIDEAGQATPQAAVGGIWRSKNVVVVGDPLQLEPVITLPLTAQQILRAFFQVSEHWVPTWTSVQMIADQATRYGTSIPFKEKSLWIGAPLRVHRRCDNPMFEISNEIAYDGLMVAHVPKRHALNLPESCWHDVVGQTADGHFIVEEYEALESLLTTLTDDGCAPDDIFLISPFKQVVNRLRELKITYPDLKVGTIHTTQGKEAQVVILVLGGDPKRPGAKKWASQAPNLLNVAVSRAKRRLYVIGDRKKWMRFSYFDTLANKLPMISQFK